MRRNENKEASIQKKRIVLDVLHRLPPCASQISDIVSLSQVILFASSLLKWNCFYLNRILNIIEELVCWHRVDVVFSCFHRVQPYFDFESTYLSIELFCTQWQRIFFVRYKETGRWEEWQRKKINWSDIKSAMGVTARNHLDWFLIIKKTKTEKHFLVIHLDLEQANALILYGGLHIYIYIYILYYL